jgi:WW domain-binding protein 11
MGKKNGRFVNPADQQRKQDRKRELKRNKKQRTETREAIVKSRDPEEIIDQLRHVDEQIYDPDKTGKETLQIKRKKTLASFYSILSFVRAQKNTSRAKELQNMIDSYENERRVMEEKYNAVIFAREGNLDIPLPMGFATPDDAMTPASMIPIPPPAPKIHAGILKKPVERKLRKIPPGPPCIPPPEYDDYGDVPLSQISANTSSKRFKSNEASQDDMEDNYEPVEIPPDLHQGDMPSLSQMFPSIMSVPIRPPPMPVVPHVVAHPMMNRQNPNSIISAPAQVISAPVGPSQPVIAAGPQMRDLWKETTRFIPANVQQKKNPTTKPKRPISYANPIVTTKTTAVKESPKKNSEKSKDEVCDAFLASLGDLL